MSNRRITAIAVVTAGISLSLLCGVLIGLYFTGNRHAVIAGDRALPPEVTSAFVNIAKQVEPSVVHISTVVQPTKDTDDEARASVRRGIGSGVIVDPTGYVLTNHHVISGVDRVKVRLFDSTEYAARIVGSDRDADLAVLKFEPRGQLAAARIGDSDADACR